MEYINLLLLYKYKEFCDSETGINVKKDNMFSYQVYGSRVVYLLQAFVCLYDKWLNSKQPCRRAFYSKHESAKWQQKSSEKQLCYKISKASFNIWLTQTGIKTRHSA